MTYSSWTYNALTAEQFLAWAKQDKESFEEFFNEHLIPLIQELEELDYFGTEGFDKRFA